MIDMPKYELKKWPKPPRKICNSLSDQRVGILSPSLLYRYMDDSDVAEYIFNIRRYKLYRRVLNKTEYKLLTHYIRVQGKE